MKFKGMVILLAGWSLVAFGQEIPGSKLTLKLAKATVFDVVKQISEQSGNLTTAQISESGGSSLKKLIGMAPANLATLEAKDELYWNVILNLCEKNKLTLADWRPEGEAQVVLMPGEWKKQPTVISGACMMQITQTEAQMTRDFRSAPRRAIQARMKMRFEPKLGVMKISQPIIEQAETNDGESLAPNKAKNDEPRFNDLFNPTLHETTFDLNYKPGVKSLKTLSGKIWAIQEVKSEDWVIETDKAVGATRSVCDLDTLKITGLRQEGNQIFMDMEIASETRDENLMSYTQISQRMRYEGYENQPGVHTNLNEGRSRMDGKKLVWACKFSTNFQRGLSQMPAKLKIRVPTEVKALQIPFEFKDLQLP